MKAKRNGILVLVALLVSGMISVSAQESSNFSFGADVVSRYVWRGANLGGSSPHIQPSVEYSFGGSGLAIGAWGSHALAGSTGAEADLYLTYSFLDMFTLGVTDYFFNGDAQFGRDAYFDYNKETTGHTLELMASFDGTESFPISLLFAMNFYGGDGTDENGDPYYAKYVELGYSKSLADMDLSLFVGAALDDPKEEDGAVGWYGNSAGIVNIGLGLSKSVKVTEEYSLPLSSSVIFNPEAEVFHLVFGISF
jgi:hypothetical protein